MGENNNFIIVKITKQDREGNNAQVSFIDKEEEFINFLIDVKNDISQCIVFKNGKQMSTYDCLVELRTYEKKIKIWATDDNLGGDK